MYYPPKGFHTAREYNKLDFVAKKARHRCRASQLLSRVTASDLFFQDLPLRSKDFQTWCLKALEQQWKLNKASHQSPISPKGIYLFGSTTLKRIFYISRFKTNIFRLTPLKSSDNKETRTRHRSSTDFQQSEFIYSNPPPPTS